MRGKRKAALLAASLAALLCLPFLCLRVALALEPLDAEAFRSGHSPSTRIYDRNGVLLREVANGKGQRSYAVSLEEVAPRLVEAIIAAEDERFYSHAGVDWLAAFRALLFNGLNGRRVSGASTITMQLARLAYGHPHSLGGKLRQAFDALRLEAALDKKEILEEYLSRVPLGSGCEGVEAASLRFFSKPSAELGLAEAALLAGMIQAPSLYDPLAEPAAARKRGSWVLGRMLEARRISREEHEAALAQDLPSPRAPDAIKAGHFGDFALTRARGASEIRTSLDWRLQESAEALTSEHVRRNGTKGLTNAAVLVLDNATGGILAMVGSKGWSADESGFVNGALARRQPGSTLKPFAYALAFERGWTPASMLADIETEYVSSDRALYLPRNYSRTFRGPVLAKESLASSLNIPAIRLVREVGVEDFLVKLRMLGFASLDRGADYYGLGLVLGNGEVNLLELAGAYSALARDGEYLEPTPFLGAGKGLRAIEPEAAWLVTTILSDEALRVQAFGSDSPLLVGYPMAVKTGTSSNWRDSWTIGYTREFTIAVWAGDFESSSMNQVSGSVGAGPLFNSLARLMEARLGRMPSLPEAPPGARKALVCAESGHLPGPACPRRMAVAFAGDPPHAACAIHSFARVDTRDGGPADASTPAIFIAERLAYELPPEYAHWLKDSGKYSLPPREPARVGRGSTLAITRPRPGDVYILEPGYDPRHQTLELALNSRQRLAAVDWYIDGSFHSRAAWPYSAAWQLKKGNHSVVARSGELESPAIRFEVR